MEEKVVEIVEDKVEEMAEEMVEEIVEEMVEEMIKDMMEHRRRVILFPHLERMGHWPCNKCTCGKRWKYELRLRFGSTLWSHVNPVFTAMSTESHTPTRTKRKITFTDRM